MKKGFFVFPLIVSAACVGGVLAFSPSASAAIDGENGPIIYIDNEVAVDNGNDNPTEEKGFVKDETVSQVITTGSNGTNEQVAATEEDTITAAGISPPTTDGNYNIAYGVESTSGCKKYEATCAVVNKVTTAGDGTVVEGQELLANLDSLVMGNKWFNSKSWVNNLSYSPDGETVLATQYSYQVANPKAAVIAIDNETGTTTTIVGPSSDSYMNAGYADDGTIYYSKTTRFNTDIWYILPGQTTSQQLTSTRGMSEYFLDVSPDSKTVLVADVRSSFGCLSAYGMLANRQSSSYNNCKFYLVSTEDGTATQLTDLPSGFIPVYFSPDNSSLIGTVFPVKLLALAREVSTNEPYTAAFNLVTKELVALTNRVGVEQWSPLAQVTPTPVPTPEVAVAATPVVAVSTTLPNTGSSAVGFMAVVLALALASFVAVTMGAKSFKK